MNRGARATLILGLVALLVASLVLAVTFGPADIGPTEVWQTIAWHLGLDRKSVV